MTAPIQHLLRSHPRDIGGFAVRRVLPSVPKQMVGPFIFFDHMGPARLAPGEGLDVRPHPHIGLATVTYLFEGEILHRDSLGSVQAIRPGDVNWMTAGPRDRALGADAARAPQGRRQRARDPDLGGAAAREPRRSSRRSPITRRSTLPLVERQGASVRVIAGHAFGARSPVAVFTDTLYAAAELEPGASLIVPPEHAERGVYVVEGNVTIGDDGVEAGQLAVLEEGVEVEVRAPFSATLMLLGGAKLDGPRFIWWNFVSSSKERIERAKRGLARGPLRRRPGRNRADPAARTLGRAGALLHYPRTAIGGGAMSSIKLVALAGVAAVAMAQPGFAQTTLTMSSWVSPQHHLTRVVLAGWAADVEKATNGRLKFQMLPKHPAAAPGTFDAVRDGLVDVSYVTASYTPARHILRLMPELPGMGDTAEVNSVAYRASTARMLARSVSTTAWSLIGVFTHGPGQMFTKQRDQGSLRIQGLKIRIGGGVVDAVAKALGASASSSPRPSPTSC